MVRNNPAKYINHSCDGNCEAVNEDGEIWIYSVKKINKGEELSYDYGYDMEHFFRSSVLLWTKKCHRIHC